MPSPSQLRYIRVQRLIEVTEDLIEAGVSKHFLFGKLDRFCFRLWPELREGTRRSYVISALRVIMSQPTVASELLTEVGEEA